MKTTFATLLASVCLLFFGSLQRSEAQDISVDFDYFYNELAPYGDWIEVEGYGYCFRPTVSYEDETWQPYTVGTWVESDAGWTWMSEEDFGWACYHYGRWLMMDGYWVWVPGYEWGPGWVSWRSSDEYVGWAPLPPEARWNSSSGISSNVDVVFDIGPRYYSFIAIRDFGVDNCRPHLIERSRNVTIINNTINITNITYRDTDVHYHRIYNAGPRFDDIRRFSQHDIRRLKLDFHDRRENDDRRHRSFVENDRLAVFAPRVERREERRPPKEVKARIERDKADRGWKGIEREQASRIRERFAEEKRPEGERRQDGPARAIPLPREDGDREQMSAEEREREGRSPNSPRGPRSEDRDSESRRPGMPGTPNTATERERDGERQRGENDRPPSGPGSDRERGDNNDRPGGSPQEQQQQEQRNRERIEERARENQRESRPAPRPQTPPAERMREQNEGGQSPQSRPRPQENREQQRPREMERQQRPQVQPQQQQRQQERERPRPQEAQRPQPQPQQQERRERQRPQSQPQQERRQEPRQERPQAQPQQREREARGGGGERRGGGEGRGREKKDD